MDSTIWIVAYSKYSKMCDELFTMIEALEIPTPFQYLDIDNKALRKRIKQTSDFSIEYVPCIISISAMGVASQYEGQKAFEIVKMMQPPPKKIERPVSQSLIQPEIVSEPEPEIERERRPVNQEVTLIESLLDDPVVDEPKNPPPAIKGRKISASQVMKTAPTLEEPRQTNAVAVIEQKKTGEKISVAEIMSRHQ